MEGAGTQVEIDEAGARDFDFADRIAVAERRDDLRRDVTRTLTRRLGQPHGDVAGEITMVRVARALDRAVERKIAGCLREFGKAVECAGDEIGDDAFHGAPLNQNNSIGSTSIDQRTLRANGSCSSAGRNSRSTPCSALRSLDCSNSCAR